jgi:5-methylthioadenosine/S-adenosylhomocysteine deaminase
MAVTRSSLLPFATPIYDPFPHLVFAARAADVRHVLVRGRVQVKDWQATTIDEERVRAQAAEVAARIRG